MTQRLESVRAVAAAMGVCPKTVLKWVARAQAEPAPAVGVGEEYRLSTVGILVAEGRVAHLTAFPPQIRPKAER